jgi:hypothetical protein
MKTKKIVIRKTHIVQGTAGINAEGLKSDSCPLALALNEQTGYKASVGWTWTFLTSLDGKTTKFENSGKVQDFIQDFDDGHHVRPRSFILDVSTLNLF